MKGYDFTNLKNNLIKKGYVVKTFENKEGLLIVRKGKAGETKYLPKGNYTLILSPQKENNSYYSGDLDYSYSLYFMTVEDVTIKSFKINSSSISLQKDKKKALKAVINPSYVTKKIAWSTSNSKVATVNNNGTVTAKTMGTTTIAAKIGSKKATCKVNVNSAEITLIKGRTLSLASYITNIRIFVVI